MKRGLLLHNAFCSSTACKKLFSYVCMRFFTPRFMFFPAVEISSTSILQSLTLGGGSITFTVSSCLNNSLQNQTISGKGFPKYYLFSRTWQAECNRQDRAVRKQWEADKTLLSSPVFMGFFLTITKKSWISPALSFHLAYADANAKHKGEVRLHKVTRNVTFFHFRCYKVCLLFHIHGGLMTFETGIFGMLSKTQTSQTCFLSLWTSSDVTDLSNYFV